MPNLLFLILLCLLLTSCKREPEALPTIRLGHALHDHHAALFVVAQLPDFFRQKGDLYLHEIEYKKQYQLVEKGEPIANVLLSPGTGGAQLIRQLHETQIDMVLGGVPAIIKNIDVGSELKMVAPLMSEGAALVMGKNFPADNWFSFVTEAKKREVPIRIGYKIQTSVQNLVFEQALKTENINFSYEQAVDNAQVVMRNLFGAQNLIPALQNDLIDGFVVMQPFAALAEYQNIGKSIVQLSDLPPNMRWRGLPCCAMAANDFLLEKKRDLLIKLVTLLLRANQYLETHPNESAVIVARWLELPLQVEKLSLPTIKYLTKYSKQWHSGIEFWIADMDEQGKLTGVLHKHKKDYKVKNLLYDMDIYEQARHELRKE